MVSMPQRVRALTDGHTQVIIDDRTLDKRTIELLAATLARQDQDGDATAAAPAAAKKPMRLRPAKRSRGPMRESRMKGA